jgi:small subunit ribosomal protein S8
MTDPIADLLTRIRNAVQARHDVALIPHSIIKEAILVILKNEGFISNFVREAQKPQDQLKVFLRYDAKKKSVIHKLRRISSPGGRIYMSYKDLRPTLRGLGLSILSTPQGIITDQKARELKVGGEVLCEVS